MRLDTSGFYNSSTPLACAWAIKYQRHASRMLKHASHCKSKTEVESAVGMLLQTCFHDISRCKNHKMQNFDAKWISSQDTGGGISKWSNLMLLAWQRVANRLPEASPLVWMPIVWTNFPQCRWRPKRGVPKESLARVRKNSAVAIIRALKSGLNCIKLLHQDLFGWRSP